LAKFQIYEELTTETGLDSRLAGQPENGTTFKQNLKTGWVLAMLQTPAMG
jgi:hypothetical protein